MVMLPPAGFADLTAPLCDVDDGPKPRQELIGGIFGTPAS
jgi:hypothetical protein